MRCKYNFVKQAITVLFFQKQNISLRFFATVDSNRDTMLQGLIFIL